MSISSKQVRRRKLNRFFTSVFLLVVLILVGSDSGFAKVIYVAHDSKQNGSGTSWNDALSTISEGQSSAVSEDEIWVKSGKYNEAIVLNRVLYGGFIGTEIQREQRDWSANATIIDATGLNTHAVTGNRGMLDGFTITGGSAQYGGGLYCNVEYVNGCYIPSATIVNCTITNNSASEDGGGVYVNEYLWCQNYSNPDPTYVTLINCVIVGNTAGDRGGGVYSGYAYPNHLDMIDCTITGNRAKWGGGIYSGGEYWDILRMTNCDITRNYALVGGGIDCSSSNPLLTNCTIAENVASVLGSGVYCVSSSPKLIGCTIKDNVSSFWHGGGVYCTFNSSPILENCIIVGNQAEKEGGAIYTRSFSSPILTNCALIENRAGELAGGLYSDDSSAPILTNCILWNEKEEIAGNAIELATVSYSNVENGWPGEGNIGTDPLFVDSGNGNYRLLPGSPCIDAGSNAAALSIPTDLDGMARIWDGDAISGAVVDMGPYEFSSVSPTSTATPWPGLPGDENRDGRVSALELSRAISYFRGVLTTPHLSVDTNGDGVVSSVELSSVITSFREIP